jgi:hypothetical protein
MKPGPLLKNRLLRASLVGPALVLLLFRHQHDFAGGDRKEGRH